MTPVVLPAKWDLTTTHEGGGWIGREAQMRIGAADDLCLRVEASPGGFVSADLVWKHLLPGSTQPPINRVALVLEANISGAGSESAAIRAVEEAAIIAGWATRAPSAG